MIVFLNGQFLPAEQALVSASDRGFLLGDGVFETLRVCHGRPFRWAQHWQRLERGASLLRLALPSASDELRAQALELIRLNQLPEAVLRLQVTRGPGPRGLSAREAGPATVLLSLGPAPERPASGPPRWRLATVSVRVSAGDPLLNVKSCSRLPWVLARAEAEARGADAALLLNTAGRLAEADCANLFWLEGETVCTPPLEEGALPGITRAVVLELAGSLGLGAAERPAAPAALRRADGVFLTLSTWGIVEVGTLDGEPLGIGPAVTRLYGEHRQLVERESR